MNYAAWIYLILVIGFLTTLTLVFSRVFKSETISQDFEEYEEKRGKVKEAVEKESDKKVLGWFKGLFSVFVFSVFLSGCGSRVIVMSDPPLFPNIEMQEKEDGIFIPTSEVRRFKVFWLELEIYRESFLKVVQKLER